jgi:Leucine-rich repeat (LRR) protein
MSESTVDIRSKRRRWLRFSLRSCFILITILAAVMAWVGHERIQSRYELKITERLTAHGLEVDLVGPFDDETRSRDGQAWWRTLLGKILGLRIKQVSARGKSIKDLTPVTEFKDLQRLYISDTEIGDFTPLCELKDLRDLEIVGTQLSDLTPLTDLLELTELNLRGNQVSDLRPLAKLRKLDTFTLAEELVIDLGPLSELDQLIMLNLENCSELRDIGPLAGCRNLYNVSLDRTKVTDLTPLAGLMKLHHLQLNETPVTDLSPLAGLKNLERLHLDGTQVSNQQVEALQQALPNCYITR